MGGGLDSLLKEVLDTVAKGDSGNFDDGSFVDNEFVEGSTKETNKKETGKKKDKETSVREIEEVPDEFTRMKAFLDSQAGPKR